MKVKCIHESYRSSKELSDQFASNIDAKLHISCEKEYIVYAISTEKGQTDYLIRDDNYLPDFYSSKLFEIIDSQLPYEEWHFACHCVNNVEYFTLGSKEMSQSYLLIDSIVLHDNEGLLYFEEWRKLVDRQYE